MKYRNLSLELYVKKLSSAQPVPGGGSATALVASLGIGLSLMVARITAQKASVRDKRMLRTYIRTLTAIHKRTLACIDNDPKAYERVLCCYRIPRIRVNRRRKLDAALVCAYNVMRDLCRDLVTVHDVNIKIFVIARGAIANDLCLSEVFVKAALSSAISTASLNADYVNNKRMRERLCDEIQQIDKKRRQRKNPCTRRYC